MPEASLSPTGAAPKRLREGEGQGKLLYLDAFSGLAGDMILASLLDLGLPWEVLEQTAAALPLRGFRLHQGQVTRHGIVATTFDVEVTEPQPHRTYGQIDAMLVQAALPAPVKEGARRTFRLLGEAEAAVHRMPLEDVHFHEVGSVDAIVDIVGASAALAWLGAEVVVSPLPMGRGFVRAQHGILPLPAPATLGCLRGVPTYAVPLEVELVTPTGAALVATHAARFGPWPSMASLAYGFGAGARDLPDRPNVLRAVLGSPVAPGGDFHRGGAPDDGLVVLEANVDDLTGEQAAWALSRLLEAGALDAWATPVLMKKGRPGLVLSALAPLESAEALCAVFLRETTTLGVRRSPVGRRQRPRQVTSVQTPLGVVRVKVAEGDGLPPAIKPEFEDCAALARQHGLPLRSVVDLALAAYAELAG